MSEHYRMFLRDFPEHTLSHSKFKNIVKDNCKIRFGSVRSDICEICEKIHVDLAAARRKNDTASIEALEQEKNSHLTQAQSFYDKLTFL